jgi:hypothetical protein
MHCYCVGQPDISGAAMRTAEEYLRKAEECERMASQASDLRIKAEFADLARQWRDLPSKPAAFGTGQTNRIEGGYRRLDVYYGRCIEVTPAWS